MDEATQKESKINPSIELKINPSHEISQPDEKLLAEHSEMTHPDGGVLDSHIDKASEDWSDNPVHQNQVKVNDNFRKIEQHSDLLNRSMSIEDSSNKEEAYHEQDSISDFVKEQNRKLINPDHVLELHGQNLEKMTLPENAVRKGLMRTTLDAWKLPYKSNESVSSTQETSNTAGVEEIKKMGEEITEEIHEEAVKAEEAGENVMSETNDELPQVSAQMASPEDQTVVQTAEKKNEPQELPEDLLKAVEWREQESVVRPPSGMSELPNDHATEASGEDQQQVTETQNEGTSETESQGSITASNVGKTLDEISKQLQSDSANPGAEEANVSSVGDPVQAPVIDVTLDAPQVGESIAPAVPTPEVTKPETSASSEPAVAPPSSDSTAQVEAKSEQSTQDEEARKHVETQLKELNEVAMNAQSHLSSTQVSGIPPAPSQEGQNQARVIQTSVTESSQKKRGGLFSWLTGFTQDEQSK